MLCADLKGSVINWLYSCLAGAKAMDNEALILE
jgi:hypothetical protein